MVADSSASSKREVAIRRLPPILVHHQSVVIPGLAVHPSSHNNRILQALHGHEGSYLELGDKGSHFLILDQTE